jgi:hypothetical protein
VSSAASNFVLFQTDLFVYRQKDEDIDRWFVGGDCAGWFYARLLGVDGVDRDFEPLMEDWGWMFSVKVDDVKVNVYVWSYYDIENCWLFGLQPKGGWLQRPPAEKLRAAQSIVADALERILVEDARFVKRAWFAENPFDLMVKAFGTNNAEG